MPKLFNPLTLRGITLRNRIGMPAMCQYSATDGMAADWHLVHYGARAAGGVGLIISEAMGVCPEGRISPFDLGLWEDRQIEPLAKVTRFVHAQGAVMGVQLAHAGRKGSMGSGWQKRQTLSQKDGGWEILAPSAISFGAGLAEPKAMDAAAIKKVVVDFASATLRAKEAGFKLIEVHAAHGYLLHQFLSPLSNQRQDAYGGSFENRSRLLFEVVAAIRKHWPDNLPLVVRISATDWAIGGWDVTEAIELCRLLKDKGVDLIDVSSGGLVPTENMPIGPGYQTHFAARIRHEAAIPTAAVGLITSPEQAEHILHTGQADLVMIGRSLLNNPHWPLQAAQTLGATPEVSWPQQYLRCAPRDAVNHPPKE